MSDLPLDSKIELKLGYIIKINADDNDTLNEKMFYIYFLKNNSKLKLINLENNELIEISINDNILDPTQNITSIEILHVPEENGYAKQNNLIPYNFISLVFEDDEKKENFINGKIVNIDEDQIQIELLENKENIYIDFAYTGIPEELNIKRIEIIDTPISYKEPDVDEEKQDETITKEISDVLKQDESIDDDDELDIRFEIDITKIDKTNVKTFVEIVDVEKEYERYTLEIQINDLLDQSLANIPNINRTTKIYNDIYTQIERFKELREQFSVFDEYYNITSIKKNTSSMKPLKNELNELNYNLKWLLYISKVKLNIYNKIDNDNESFNSFINNYEYIEELKSYNNYEENYMKNEAIDDNKNSYYDYNKLIAQSSTPYLYFDKNNKVLKTLSVNKNINTILDVFDSVDRFLSPCVKVIKFKDDGKTYYVNDLKISKFTMLNFITGEHKFMYENINSKDNINKEKINVIENEKIPVKSLLRLPLSIINFSKINLPTTNILNKSCLNLNYLCTKLLFTKNINIKEKIITQNSKANLFEDINDFVEYKLDDSYFKNDKNEDLYNILLNKIIKSNKKIFNTFKSNKNITNKYSFNKILHELHPFMIFYDKLTKDDYDIINKTLKENIKNYTKTYFSTYKQINDKLSTQNIIFVDTPYYLYLQNVINNNSQLNFNDFKSLYSIINEENNKITNTELVRKLLKTDNSVLFSFLVSLININLLDSIDQNKIDEIKQEIENELVEENDNDDFEDTNIRKDIKKRALQQIIDKLTESKNIDFKEITIQITNKFNLSKERIKLIKTITLNQLLIYNNILENINKEGQILLNDFEPIISKYANLRNVILGTNDFVKKQNLIISFKNKFCREPTEDEDNYFYYCIESNTKLLPKFIFELAVAFKNENYMEKIEEIKKRQGTISDDENSWVDKYSGYLICNIDFAVQEQYNTEGMKIVSRGILDEDIEFKKKEEINKPKLSIYVENVLNVLIRYLRIEINEQENLIQTIIYYIKNKANIEDESTYSNRKTSYNNYYNSFVILYTITFFMIELQTQTPHHIPGLKIPGCTPTQFLGSQNDTNFKKDIKYLACLLNLIRNRSSEPWSSIANYKKEKIESIINNIYNEIKKNISSIETIYDNKKVYFESTNYLDTIDLKQINIETWESFLPRIKPIQKDEAIKFKKIDEKLYNNELKDYISNKNSEQHNKLSVVIKKQKDLSLLFLQRIHKILQDQKILLKTSNNEPFLENNCCNYGNINALEYFIENDTNKQLSIYLNLSKKYITLLKQKFLEKSSIIFFNFDTRREIKILNDKYDEEVMLKFILKNNNEISKKDVNNINENFDNIEDKKIFLRDNYNIEIDYDILQELINNISKGNLNKINKFLKVKNIELLENFLNKDELEEKKEEIEEKEDEPSDEDNNDNISEHMRFLEEKLNIFVSKKEYNKGNNKELRKEIQIINKTLLQEIRNFIEINNTYNDKKTLNKCNIILDELVAFKSNEEISTELLIYLENSIRNIINVYPTIIKNNKKHFEERLPTFWKFSDYHNITLNKYLKKHYSLLNEFLNNDLLKELYNVSETKLNHIANLLSILNYGTNINIINENKYGVFEESTIYLLQSNLYLQVFTILIESLTYEGLPTINLENIANNQNNTAIVDDDDNIINISDIDITGNNKQQSLANLLVVFIKLLDQKNIFKNNDYEKIKRKTLILKEKEKISITDTLKNMNEQDRKVDNTLKTYKLGRWSIGNNSGVVKYNADYYDMEKGKENIGNENTLEFGFEDQELIQDITQDEIVNVEEVQQFNDVINMNEIPDDDDYGENMDGDEMYR